MLSYIFLILIIFLLMLIEKLAFLSNKKLYKNNLQSNNEVYVNGEYNQTFHEKKKFSYSIIVAIIIIFSFSAFRYDVGWDYKAYYNTIEYNVITNIVSNGEYANIFLIDFTRYTGFTFFYFIITSFLCIFFISKTIRSYSENYWLSLILFICFPLFFLNSLSVIRLFSALALTFYGFKYIEKKQFTKYLIMVIFASMFHKSAMIALIFYFANKIKFKNFKLLLFLISLPIIGNFINDFVIRYLPKYAVYTQETTIQEGTKAIIIFIIIGIIAMMLNKKITDNDRIANLYYNIYFMGLGIYLMFFNQGTMGHRLSLYGTIYMILLLPKMVSLIENKKERICIIAFIYMLSIIMFFYTVYVGAETYIPYRSILNL